VTNYRGKVLQIRSLFASDVTETSDGRKKFAKAKTPLVICKYSGSQFGLLVQQILDVVNISEEIQDQSTSTPSLEKESDSDRFTLVNGKVVEVVDLKRECHLALGVGG
jgi:chemotaxis signal transduction protein